MDWFLVAIAVVLLVHVFLAVLLWRGIRYGSSDEESQLMARSVFLRFVLVPLILIVILVATALLVPDEPEQIVGWILVTALIAYFVYLSLSVIYFGLRLMREQRR